MTYPDDPALRAAVLPLFGSVWPRLPAAIERARGWGADWYEVSTPFVRFDGGAAVGHVGVIEIPLRLGGRDVVVAGVHGVCVHPDHRGRGHLREAMREALAWIDARYATAILWTSEPAIYTRYGFRRRQEHVFAGPSPARPGAAPAPGAAARAMSMRAPEDVRRLRDRLARRRPVSELCAARDAGWLFLIDLALWPEGQEMIRFVPDLECVVVYETRGDTLVVHDAVAPEPPPLAELAARLGGAAQIEVRVTPDVLGAAGLVPSPHPGVDLLMERGQPLDVTTPFAISELSHC